MHAALFCQNWAGALVLHLKLFLMSTYAADSKLACCSVAFGCLGACASSS
jgi:hypothetical protein